MIEIIKAAFTAGEVKTFLIQGEYVEILECAYPVDVAMMDRSGAQLSTMRNAEASYFSRPGKYEVIQVTSATAQTVRLFVGSGDAGTRRTSGDVLVIDGNKSRTVANKAFAGYASCAQVAATMPYVQLWNPAGSGLRLIVETMRMGSAGATDVFCGFTAAALTTFVKNNSSKLSGGANSASELRIQNSSAELLSGVLFTDFGPVNNSRKTDLKEPIVVLPGYGLAARTAVNATDVVVNFEFYEETI